MRVEASAPGKAILFGEHFVVYGGRAVATAIELRVRVAAEERDSAASVIRGPSGEAVHRPGEAAARGSEMLAGLIDAMRGRYGADRGVDVSIRSDIPQGAGLGSSSACCVAAAAAVSGAYADAAGRGRMDVRGIMDAALAAERRMFPGASGVDTAISALGGTILYRIGLGAGRIPVHPECAILVIASSQRHSTAGVVERVRAYRESNPEAFGGMMESQEAIVDEAVSALARGDAESLGSCMRRNQGNLAGIGVSTGLLREMTDAADSATHGSKITGAGGGGCIVAVPKGGEGLPYPERVVASRMGCPGVGYG